MATSIFGLLLSNSTVENFRAWGGALSAQIGAILTRVPQSNDIDWATVALPATNSSGGSEVYRFNDSLQATKPLLIKFEYGTGVAAGLYRIQATVGKSADGDGNLSGVLLAATTVLQQSSSPIATATENCYISGGSSWFALSLAPINTQRGGYFAIERSTDGTANAVHIAIHTTANSPQTHRFVDYDNATAETTATGIVAIPLDLSTDRSIANGTVAPIFPAACISPSGVYWRPRVILGTARQNAGLGEVITGLIDGNSYLSLGAGSQRADQRSGVFAATLIRWD